MLVVDESALTKLVLGRAAGEVVGEYLAAHGFALHAPHLVYLEVLSALRRLVASGEMTAARAGEAISDLLDLPIERFPHDILVPRVCELRENLYRRPLPYHPVLFRYLREVPSRARS
jgi:predicted nucleic acid-binding protein